MFSKARLMPNNESSRKENRPPSSNSRQREVGKIAGGRGKTTEDAILTGAENSSPSSTFQRKEGNPIEIDGQAEIWSVAFLCDGKHIVSGGWEKKIRCWRVEDGKEVGMPIDAGSHICNIAVSRDGKWIVSGTYSGRVTVWNALTHEKATDFKGHKNWVRAVDVSPDGTKLATASDDNTACVWSLSTAEPLLRPLQQGYHHVTAIKFSPDGRFIATATWRDSIRVYDSRNGYPLLDLPIQVNATFNQSLTWTGNSKHLLALSLDGNVNWLDVSDGKILAQWRIHSSREPLCITLASNGAFIAVSDESSVSFWDTRTYKQIGSVVKHTADVVSMAISANSNLVIGGGRGVTLRNIYDVFPSSYFEVLCREEEIQRMRVKMAGLEGTIESLRTQEDRSNEKIANFRNTVQQLRTELSDSQHKADTITQILCAHEQKHRCEVMFAQGRTSDAAKSLLEITNTMGEAVRANKLLMDWFTEFKTRCAATLEIMGDETSNIGKHDEALAAYSIVLLLSPSTPNTVLIKWVRTILIHSSANETLDAVAKFKLPRFDVYRAICDALEENNRITEAIECFRQMQRKLAEDTSSHGERAEWELGFRQRCIKGLEKLGNIAMESQNYHGAAEHFSTILSLGPMDRIDILIKRSKARVLMSSWEEALNDADEVTMLDPSSHWGYEQKHAALHGARRYSEAVQAFYTMLLKLERSPDKRIRELRRQYVDATPTIRHTVEKAVLHMPRVLIDTTTGRLYDKRRQVDAFEALPLHNELVSSMTTGLDFARIKTEVKSFYRYVMLSHKWQHDEPTFQLVENISIYELPALLAHRKLQRFCKLVRSLGFKWAWSDTCCVNQLDRGIHHESLVAMFGWYRGSSLTIVHLLGVLSNSQQSDCLWKSIWNTRGWTYQEYIASKVVQFYTEDWKPYLGLDIPNHKESARILSEMSLAMNFATQELASLLPGLDRVREKLYLASKRQTTREEDIAYSLFGIFNVAIPVMYGEGIRAVGRLLEHILTGSSDVTILAWTGRAGNYNSCLPVDLAVYNDLVPPHVPQLSKIKMDSVVMALRSSLPDPSLAMMLHDRLHGFPPPSLAASRLRLPCIVFRLNELVCISNQGPMTKPYVYCAATTAFGDIEFKTAHNLTGAKDLCLVHPWIRPLLDQEFSDGATALDRTTQALRIVARLRQPFGALLFQPVSRVEYKRVATDSLITVQVREEVPLTELINNVRTIEVQ